MSILPKLIYRFNPNNISAGIFTDIANMILKFVYKCKGPRIDETTLKKNEVRVTLLFSRLIIKLTNQD